MSRRFDPYHRWLGIPPHEQPPDHYRLLGLARFEAEADVIATAAVASPSIPRRAVPLPPRAVVPEPLPAAAPQPALRPQPQPLPPRAVPTGPAAVSEDPAYGRPDDTQAAELRGWDGRTIAVVAIALHAAILAAGAIWLWDSISHRPPTTPEWQSRLGRRPPTPTEKQTTRVMPTSRRPNAAPRH